MICILVSESKWFSADIYCSLEIALFYYDKHCRNKKRTNCLLVHGFLVCSFSSFVDQV